MKFIQGIKEIADNYEYFIFDVWGVIHDGVTAYPGAAEAVAFLRSKGKKICFLSNAPRRAHKVAEVLKKHNVTPNLYDFILTSGEAAFLDLEKNQKNNYQNFGKNYFYIGPKKDMDLLEGLDYVRVESASLADFAITTGFDHDFSTLEEKMPDALEAKKYNLPMICVNPDLIVIKQDGHEMICAGALAREYERLGGEVIYYGKPFNLVYKMTCEISQNFDNEKIIAIGDGLETDIKGAVDIGIDSVLVTGGILSNILEVNYTQTADRSKLEAVCNDYQLFPQFVISSLKI
jgi:HAD superfamily hydrolase (TIGR01459 family)